MRIGSRRSWTAVWIALAAMLICDGAYASALSSAAKRGKVDKVRKLIESGVDLDEQDSRGNSAIYQAAYKGHSTVVQMLVDAGADFEIDNRFGSTPLHVAARYGHVDVIRVLAAAGADLDVKTKEGGLRTGPMHAQRLKAATPLDKAARAGEFEAAKALIELGASLPARSSVEQASLRGHDHIAEYISRATVERQRSEREASKMASTGRPIDLSSDYQNRIAVVIGIDRYDRMTNLEGAVRDARSTSELLRVMGFDRVYELFDEQATREKILELVGQTLRDEVGENDLVFVFFAGHGATETLRNGEKRGYLLPKGGSSADPFVSGISMETVRDLSNRLAARHVYYAIDACYSGGLMSAAGETFRGDSSNRSVQVLTAGTEGQQAIELGGRGVFTTYLLQALEGEANMNGDEVVTASEIGAFVANQVNSRTGGRQTPSYGRLGGTGEVRFLIR